MIVGLLGSLRLPRDIAIVPSCSAQQECSVLSVTYLISAILAFVWLPLLILFLFKRPKGHVTTPLVQPVLAIIIVMSLGLTLCNCGGYVFSSYSECLQQTTMNGAVRYY